jgi:xanthine/CO dehydrogenase XdhC/CoxF family maturation factor
MHRSSSIGTLVLLVSYNRPARDLSIEGNDRLLTCGGGMSVRVGRIERRSARCAIDEKCRLRSEWCASGSNKSQGRKISRPLKLDGVFNEIKFAPDMKKIAMTTSNVCNI